MFLENYFNSIGEGVEYLIAVGSIIGLLGLIFGFIMMLAGGKRYQRTALPILVVAFILVAICGL